MRRGAIGQTGGMQEAFGIAIFGVVIIASLVAVATLASSRSGFDQIGANGLDDGTDRSSAEPPSDAGLAASRDEEARQMLEARSARRVRRGEEPLDVKRELARLIGAPATTTDPRLRSEVRELVMARNRRRVKQGKEPLDVEAEVSRQLTELG